MLPIIVNLYAGAGAGKSTTASAVFSKLKYQGVNCEIAPEFVKELVWEERFKTIEDQVYIFAKQLHRLNRLTDVDVIITDAPILNSLVYLPDELTGTSFPDLVRESYNKFDNLDFYIKRVKPYNPKGRMQTEEEAKAIDEKVRSMLNQNVPRYSIIKGNEAGADTIVDIINSYL